MNNNCQKYHKESNDRIKRSLRSWSFFIFLLTLVFGQLPSVRAHTIGTINFQGKVVRDSGLNVSGTETTCIQSGTDTCGFQMAYYSASSGGTLLATETFTNVELGNYDGVVNLALGTGSFSAGSESSFSNVFINNDAVYAELRFDHDGNASYTEVFGRLAVRGAAYAMRSSESDSLGGRSSSGYVQLSPSGVQTDSSTSSSIFINKTGASGNILQLQKNASDVLVLSNGGDLGVGITSPSARLHIVKSGVEQLRIGSDANNYYSTTVSSTGAVTFSATGTGASFNFANALLPTVNNSIALGSTNYRWSDLYLGGSSLHIGADGNEGIISYNTTNKYITIGTSNASNTLTITDEGRVGIGTSTPNASLTVFGSITSTDVPHIELISNTTNVVDSGDVVGHYSSLALGNDGFPIIAYYDVTNADLKITHCGDAACSIGNVTTTVDSSGDVGTWTDIAIGNDGNPVVSYYDATNEDLKVYACSDSSCTTGTTRSLHTSGNAGQYSSIAIGTDGNPVISYYYSDSDDLYVYKCTSSDCSTGSSVAAYETGTCGVYTSMVIGTDGNPIIAHHNYSDLLITKCGNTSCSSGNVTETVDTGAGQYISLAIGVDGFPISHI